MLVPYSLPILAVVDREVRRKDSSIAIGNVKGVLHNPIDSGPFSGTARTSGGPKRYCQVEVHALQV